MSKETTLKINPNKSAELEFEVMVQGLDGKEQPTVRFVLEGAAYDRSFKCTKVLDEKSKWCAKLPAMKDLKQDSCTFRVEVVIDGYFFAPAAGTVSLIHDPSVKFQTESTRPSVTTSFTVKQDDASSQDVTESSGGGEVTGQFAPTNDLLKPEYEPPSSHAKAPGTEKDDELIDKTKLSDLGRVRPGEGTADSDIEEFDPRTIADTIIKDRIGSVARPDKKGSLFKRDKDGKPMVDGIDTPEQARDRKERSARVKQILGTT